MQCCYDRQVTISNNVDIIQTTVLNEKILKYVIIIYTIGVIIKQLCTNINIQITLAFFTFDIFL